MPKKKADQLDHTFGFADAHKLRLIPLHQNSKVPAHTAWAEDDRPFEDVTAEIRDNNLNVGLLTSTTLVDIDDDTGDVLVSDILDHILPKTAVFGRPSTPRAHRLFALTGDPVTKTETISTTVAGALYALEIRGPRSQTMAPGSTHPSGEKVEWTADTAHDKTAAGLAIEQIRQGLSTALALRLMVNHWVDGQRHHLAGPLAGTLIRCYRTNRVPPDLEVQEYEAYRDTLSGELEAYLDLFTRVLCDVTGDADIKDRLRLMSRTLERSLEDMPHQGLSTLRRLIGPDADEIARLLVVNPELGLIENIKQSFVFVGADQVIDGTRPYMGGEALMSRQHWRNYLNNRRVRLGEKKPRPVAGLVETAPDRLQVDLVDVFPTSSSLSIAERIVEREVPGHTQRVYNMWAGFPVASAPDEELVEEANELLLQNLCNQNKQHFEYVVNWLAAMVQRPEVKAQTLLEISPVTGTGEGTGKSSFFQHLIGGALGHLVVSVNSWQYLGRFNGTLSGALLVILEEVSTQSDEMSERLKDMVTGEKIHINVKLGPQRVEHFWGRFVSLSNHEGGAIRITAGMKRRMADIRCFMNLDPMAVAKTCARWAYEKTVQPGHPDHLRSAKAYLHFLQNWEIREDLLHGLPRSAEEQADLDIRAMDNAPPVYRYLIENLADGVFARGRCAPYAHAYHEPDDPRSFAEVVNSENLDRLRKPGQWPTHFDKSEHIADIKRWLKEQGYRGSWSSQAIGKILMSTCYVPGGTDYRCQVAIFDRHTETYSNPVKRFTPTREWSEIRRRLEGHLGVTLDVPDYRFENGQIIEDE